MGAMTREQERAGLVERGTGRSGEPREASFFTTFDGEGLFWRRHPPDGDQEPRAVLAVVHGFGEHSGRYGFLVDAMTARGYALATFDLRGHGRSPGPRGHLDRYSNYLDDVGAFLRVVRSAWPSGPLVLVGHSMGGLIAASYVERETVRSEGERGPALDGLVLSSPFLGLRMKVTPLKLWAARLLSHMAPRRAMSNELRPEDLSHDQRVVAASRKDPLNHKAATPRWATEIFKAQRDAVAHAADLRLPLLLMYAGDDRIADAAVTRSLGERVAAAGATVICYEGYYHEIFNEVERERVFTDLDGWLDRLVTSAAEGSPEAAPSSVPGT